MQSVSSRIWTRVAVSISNDDNHYTTGMQQFMDKCIKQWNDVCRPSVRIRKSIERYSTLVSVRQLGCLYLCLPVWSYVIVFHSSQFSKGTPEVHSFFCTKVSPQQHLVRWCGLAPLRSSPQMGTSFSAHLHIIAAVWNWFSPVFYSVSTLRTSRLSLFQPITARQAMLLLI